MKNAVLRPFFVEPVSGETVLAPVISIKSTKATKQVKATFAEPSTVTPVPSFTDPVFKPKKHDLF